MTPDFTYELPLPDKVEQLPVLTGIAATQRVAVELDQGGWEFVSDEAVHATAMAAEEHRSAATLP